MGRHLDIHARAARKYGCPVVVIWGNHEPYGSIWSELMADEERKLLELRTKGLDIRVLHGAATEVAGVRIISATLWTDLKLYPSFEYLARAMISAYMQDYRTIRTAPKTGFTIEDMLAHHRQDRAAIFGRTSRSTTSIRGSAVIRMKVRIGPAQTIMGRSGLL